MEDGEDITEQVLTDTTYTFLLVSHQLALADDGAIDLINELYDYSLEYGYSFYCLTSSSSEDVLKWQESTGAEYPFCEVDNITLKTMIRSNPGLILIKDGVVVRKWSVNNFPDEYELGRPLDELSIGQTDFQSFVYKTIWVIVWFVFPLFLICAIDMTLKRYWNRMRELGDK